MPDLIKRHYCATMPHHFYLAETDEIYQKNRRMIETYSSTARLAPRTSVIRIPVVVHVIYGTDNENISKAQIDSQIDVLNKDFRLKNTDSEKIPDEFKPLTEDALIEFALAKSDPNGIATNGITRTSTSLNEFPYNPNDRYATQKLDQMIKREEYGKTAWPGDSYLNIWVCAIESGLLGYAQFPGGNAATDGVVINNSAFGTNGTAMSPFNLGRTAVHEIGHWLDLLHIWGDDRGGCHGSDNVSDTPNQAGPNYNVPVYPSTSCENDPHGDMFMNYMDYVNDEAMFMFTKGQVRRMNAALSGPRSSLIDSQGLIEPATEVLSLPEFPIEEAARIPEIGTESGLKPEKKFDGVDWV